MSDGHLVELVVEAAGERLDHVGLRVPSWRSALYTWHNNLLLEYNDDTAEPLMPWYFWHSW